MSRGSRLGWTSTREVDRLWTGVVLHVERVVLVTSDWAGFTWNRRAGNDWTGAVSRETPRFTCHRQRWRIARHLIRQSSVRVGSATTPAPCSLTLACAKPSFRRVFSVLASSS